MAERFYLSAVRCEVKGKRIVILATGANIPAFQL
jgi:hypothetical protein